MTLALLLTAVTGAWAQSAVASIGSENYTTLQAAFTAAETGQTIKLLSDVTQTGGVGKSDGKAVTFDLNGHIYTCTDDYSVMATSNSQITIIDSSTGTPGGIKSEHALIGQGNGKIIIKAGRYNIGGSTAEELLEYFPLWGVEMYSGYTLQDITPADAQGFCVGVVAPAPSGPKVAWDKDKKTGTFEMPGSDVVLTPIYAKAATFATTGTGTEATPLQPAAAEGVIAGTDASLIAEGTGIVAFAGTSNEVTQGTLMYAIGTSATQAPALTDFSAIVPTAKDVADDGATLYVWYYIQGADAPQGEAATLDNTFDDTEPACLTVTVLTNKFDITLNPANANTIEAGKATVTVDGAPATVTDGKLQGVKMGSEVKLEANPGYKFRKVEVKKGLVNTVDLSTLTADYEAQDGDELTGTLGANVKITIADGATVTLKDLTINGASGSSYPWAGLTPLGDATIVLEGTNTVNGFYEDYPGIFAAVGKTLTIKGDGSLTASSNKGTGIGGGRSKPCGNIVIEGGNITATGGKTSPSGSYSSAGIGGGYNTSCGNITITGGTITAKGGNYAAGIGGGGGYSASCGNITITNTVTKVTATKGSGATNSIGKGLGSCGTVTIGGVVGAISASPYTYQPGN